MGSMAGRLVFPVGGYYHASKYAVEALAGALRFEAASFGIQVSRIEPGLIRTGFGGTAARSLSGSAVPSGPYAGRNAAAEGQMAASYRPTLLTAPPEAVAKVIDRAILSAAAAAPPLLDHPRCQVPRAHPTAAGWLAPSTRFYGCSSGAGPTLQARRRSPAVTAQVREGPPGAPGSADLRDPLVREARVAHLEEAFLRVAAALR